jgi:hypothetical protein
MTTFDLSQIKPIPGFDSLKWKREVQAKIYEETKHMTREQVREYYRQAVERGDKRRAERAKAESTPQ